MITNFPTIMTWVVLLFCLIVVVLLSMSAWHLPQDRHRALSGVVGIALVVGATGISLVLLSQKVHSVVRPLLPLVAPLLAFSLYRLSFPSLVPVPAVRSNNRRSLFLLLLTLSALMTTAGLVLLDLFFLYAYSSLCFLAIPPAMRDTSFVAQNTHKKTPGPADQTSRRSMTRIA